MKNIRLSKSRYCTGRQCLKHLWMDLNMRDKIDESLINEAVLETGSEVGDLAMGYFGDFTEVKYENDKSLMIAETKKLLEEGVKTICEASFTYDNNFCSVDILRVLPQGVEIIEVMSSTELKDIYYDDMAYQMYVLKGCGLNVLGVYNLHINNQYVREGELDLKGLFNLVDCTSECRNMQADIPQYIEAMREYLEQDLEPVKSLSIHCQKPYLCPYWTYCTRHITGPSVFDINKLNNEKRFDLYNEGIVTFEDVINAGVRLSANQRRQVETDYYDEPRTVDKDKIKEFLDTLSYPLYFLDFETFQQAIPQYDGVSPYMQIPFQYSLHALRSEGAELEHYEFLGKEGTDPRRALAEQLVHDIPKNVCTLAYNMGFEKGVIRKLAENYPDLSEHLMNIHDHIKDLMVPFQKQAFYCKELHGSYSIKYVLPAICPDDPDLNYQNLEGIHNGSEAMNAFATLVNKTPEEIEKTRHNLLRYCCLDTLAMVKILEKLREITGGDQQ